MFYTAEIQIEFTTTCLAGKFDNKLERYVFERDSNGNLIFAAKYWLRMLRDATEAYLPDKVMLMDKLHPDTLRRTQLSVSIIRDAGYEYETLPTGENISIQISVPNELTLAELQNLFTQAGRWIGFSPAKARLGYGRFKVVECKAISN